MRKAIIFLAVGLLACASLAESKRLEVSVGTNGSAAVTATFEPIHGQIQEILIATPAGVVTGLFTISYQPVISTMSAITLATATTGVDMSIRPARDWTDTTGSALTSDPPGPYYIYGEQVSVTITNTVATNTVNWNFIIKYIKQK